MKRTELFLFRCIGPGYFNVIFLWLEFRADYDAFTNASIAEAAKRYAPCMQERIVLASWSFWEKMKE